MQRPHFNENETIEVYIYGHWIRNSTNVTGLQKGVLYRYPIFQLWQDICT